jgi:transcriptional regulator with XRE-family HTH domain
VNQIVAWNIAWYRRAAGMTQLEVAERLGWPHNKVSEAERSWDGKRTRQFDAQLLADLADVFGIPVVAFFLPPITDDGPELYFPAPDGDPRTMTDLMWLAMHDSDDQSPALDAYRRRFRIQAQKYTDKGWPAEVERWFTIPGQAEAMADRAAALRARAAGSRDAAKLDEELGAELEQAVARLK